MCLICQLGIKPYIIDHGQLDGLNSPFHTRIILVLFEFIPKFIPSYTTWQYTETILYCMIQNANGVLIDSLRNECFRFKLYGHGRLHHINWIHSRSDIHFQKMILSIWSMATLAVLARADVSSIFILSESSNNLGCIISGWIRKACSRSQYWEFGQKGSLCHCHAFESRWTYNCWTKICCRIWKRISS